MGCKYDRCTNDECDNGLVTINIAGRQMACPVCKGEGFLDTRFAGLLDEPEIAARIDALLGEKPEVFS